MTQFGNGAWYTTWAIFFTRQLHLSTSAVAIGIFAAGGVALLGSTPMGELADRVGPRRVFVGLLVLDAVSMAAYTLVHGLWPFIVVTVAETAASRTRQGVTAAVVAGLIPGTTERTDVLTRMRVFGHVGFAAGSGLGALTLAVNTPTAFVTLIGFNAATTAIYAALAATLPATSPLARPANGPRFAVLHDLPFVALTAITGVLALCWGILSSGLPLWVERHTMAPTWLAAVIVVINSLVTVATQRHATRQALTPLAAARTARRAGIALAISCLLFAASNHQGGVIAFTLLIAGGLANVAGEVLFVAASWGITLGLMPEHARGQYQGMAASGTAASAMLAPALTLTLVGTWGYPGWFVLAALFLAAAAPTTTLTARAIRNNRNAQVGGSPTNGQGTR